jgi:GNAT superfamily N-acetyltransferase
VTLDTTDIAAGVARRWREIDPLLPPPGLTAPHCGARLIAGGSGLADTASVVGGAASAIGLCEHWTAEAGSLELSWGAARMFRLFAAVTGPDVGGGLDALLTLWGEHLHGIGGTGDADTAAVVNWPSRDADGVATLLRHGLDPLEVLAARPARRRIPAVPGTEALPAKRNGNVLHAGGRTLIRRAGPADVEAVARLGVELIRFDSHFGAVNERPDTLAALRREVAGLLAGPEPWTWLAERDGEAIAMLAAQRPEAAGWIAPLVGAAPAAYLMLMFVTPQERSGGIGSALVEEFHAAADAAGVAVTLLHYEQLNPVSVPFWNRHGYRPLWTTWQAAPARSIR